VLAFLQDVAAPGSALPGAIDPLNTVGLALLAYGLVQLLSKIVDKLPLWRGTSIEAPGAARVTFSDEDRKRLERACELIAGESQRLQRMQEALTTQQKLIGQALDELRAVTVELKNVNRKLRGLWTRLGQRLADGSN